MLYDIIRVDFSVRAGGFRLYSMPLVQPQRKILRQKVKLHFLQLKAGW